MPFGEYWWRCSHNFYCTQKMSSGCKMNNSDKKTSQKTLNYPIFLLKWINHFWFDYFALELEMKVEPSSPTDKRQQFSRCSSTNSVITSNSSAQNSGNFCFILFANVNEPIFVLSFLQKRKMIVAAKVAQKIHHSAIRNDVERHTHRPNKKDAMPLNVDTIH